MSHLDTPLDTDDLMMITERIGKLPAAEAEWVSVLLQYSYCAHAHAKPNCWPGKRHSGAKPRRTALSLTITWHSSPLSTPQNG